MVLDQSWGSRRSSKNCKSLLFVKLHFYLSAFLINLILYIASVRFSMSRTMEFDSIIDVMYLLTQTMIWRRNQRMHTFHWNDMHLSSVYSYFTNLCLSCYFADVPYAGWSKVIFSYGGPGSSRLQAKIAASFTQQIHEFFRVPRLRWFVDREYCIKKHQLVQVFLTFLLELLYNKSEAFDPYADRIDNLKNELRFLLTILGDKSFMLYGDEHKHDEEFQNLMSEFEAVANEAGILIHSLLFSSTCQSFEDMNVGLANVLNRIGVLVTNIMRFLNNHLSCISKPACKTPDTSVLDSLILRSVIHDLEDLITREDNRIADVKDQIKILHKGLTSLQSSIKDVGLPQPSEVGELKEPRKRIGSMAHQIEYLIVSFLSGDAPLWYLINRLTNINQKMEFIATELQNITKKHKPGDLKVPKYFNMEIPLQDDGNIENADVVVVFEDRRVTYVLDYLVGRGKSLHVISISGMPGLGKTTLAKKLFNHPFVSQTYQSQSILADLLTQINGEFDNDRTLKMSSESLVVQIYKTLWRRRYLIVMDDVWDSNLWDDLMRCFPDDGNGSRILFTTRNTDVGPYNCNDYAVPSLSNEECWELLEKKVFGNNTCPPKLVGIGKKIAANCWGLPLAVIVIAGILSTMDKKKNLWEEVERNLASLVFNGGDNSVMQILELSYKHLPERLKPCFLYFRGFTIHKKIRVGKLKRLWISEGFIHKEEGKSPEDVAEEYLTELIDKSLVMVARRGSDGGVKTCVLHDLLRDLCSKICEDQNFIMIEGRSNKYSLYENGLLHRGNGYCITWSYCQQIRSLYEMSQTSTFFPGRMRLLRVLHFFDISDHLTGVEYLVNLRYLIIKDIPASIGSLVNLEYLRVETTREVCLPPAIFSMMKLRYLCVPFARYHDRCCNNLQTNNLEFLSCIRITKLEDEMILKRSPNLRKLSCQYNFDLCFLSHLNSLKLELYVFGVTEISFPSNIKKLSLSGCWMNMAWEKMSVIGRLEKLEVLKLGHLTGFEGERWDTREDEFQKLKFLKLDRLYNLKEWNVESSSHFPALQRLVLSDCENLQVIPCEIGEIETLQMIEVKGRCTESLVESAKLMQHQQIDMGYEDLRILITNQNFVIKIKR